ncbi:retinol-binding protein 2 isoform 1 [Camelus ferus]|nr:retinol-binding protein 2 isoform 1 [Camelus ferus]
MQAGEIEGDAAETDWKDYVRVRIAVRLTRTKITEPDRGKFKAKTNSTFCNYDLYFTARVEFGKYTKGLDNRNVKTLGIREGDALVCAQKGERRAAGGKQRVARDKPYLEQTCGRGPSGVQEAMAARAPTEHAPRTPRQAFAGFATPPPGPPSS